MKVTTKKLLCLLAVLTLALSLAVPAAAASEPPSTCPACGAKNVIWLVQDSYVNANVPTPGAKAHHVYLTEDIELSGENAFTTGATSTTDKVPYVQCVYLNGHTVTMDGRCRANTDGTLNIIGDGKIIRRDSDRNVRMFQMGGYGSLNVYGNVTLENQDPDVEMFAFVVGNKILFENTTLKTKTLGNLPKTTSVPPVITIEGGKYEIETLFTWHADWATADPEKQAKLNFAISGGTFNFEPKADLGKGNTCTIAEGCEVTKGTNTWTVAKKATPAPTPSTPKPSNPSTADNSALLLWAVLAITSGAALTIASKKRAVK